MKVAPSKGLGTSTTFGPDRHVKMRMRNIGPGNRWSIRYRHPDGAERSHTGEIGACYSWAKQEARAHGLAYQMG